MEYTELPVGFAMALAQSPAAMAAFGRLSPARQASCAAQAACLDSKDAMHALVDALARAGEGF